MIHNSRRPDPKGMKVPSCNVPAPFKATILYAEHGRRLAKLYRDPTQRPDDYDAGALFTAEEVRCSSFGEFVAMLASLPSDACLIRGAVKDDAKADVQAGLQVRRLAYDRDDCPAAFEPKARPWIVLDADETDSPFDSNDIEGSVHAWRATLPAEIRDAQSAFFLSASSHLSATVRGKLLVALSAHLDDDSAATFAKLHGFDPSVVHAVQPNYFAAPIFEGCTDPIANHRKPIMFKGAPATLPSVPPSERKAGLSTHRESVPDDLPPLSARAKVLADSLHDRWLEGDRIQSNAALHLFGWLLGKEWSKGEIGAMLRALDEDEPQPAKRSEHWHVLGNARPIDGLGGARDWLGDDLEMTDAIVNYDPATEGYAARLAERNARAAFHVPAAGDGIDCDTIGRIVDWRNPTRSLRYLCEGVGIAWAGKCVAVHGYAGTSKGLFLSLLALCVASGKPFLGHEVARVPVIYCDGETGATAEIRLVKLALALGVDLVMLQAEGWLTFRHVDRKLTELLPALEAMAPIIDKGEGLLLAADSYSSMAEGDENSSQYAEPLWALGRTAQRVNAVAVAVMHNRKTGKDGAKQTGNSLEQVSGTNRLVAALATSISLEASPEDEFTISIKCTRAPEKRFTPIELVWRDTPEGGIIAQTGSLYVPSQDDIRRAKDADKARKHLLTIERRANAVEAYLGRCVSDNITARKIKDACSLNAEQWLETQREVLTVRCTVTEASYGRNNTYRLATPEERAVTLAAQGRGDARV